MTAVGRRSNPGRFRPGQELPTCSGAACRNASLGLIRIDRPAQADRLSGRTVAPKLLVTLGVSGAVQFTAGMTGSQLVFSVCSDPNAPIFNVAHFGLVGDVFTIVPKLINEIKTLKGME